MVDGHVLEEAFEAIAVHVGAEWAAQPLLHIWCFRAERLQFFTFCLVSASGRALAALSRFGALLLGGKRAIPLSRNSGILLVHLERHAYDLPVHHPVVLDHVQHRVDGLAALRAPHGHGPLAAGPRGRVLVVPQVGPVGPLTLVRAVQVDEAPVKVGDGEVLQEAGEVAEVRGTLGAERALESRGGGAAELLQLSGLLLLVSAEVATPCAWLGRRLVVIATVITASRLIFLVTILSQLHLVVLLALLHFKSHSLQRNFCQVLVGHSIMSHKIEDGALHCTTLQALDPVAAGHDLQLSLSPLHQLWPEVGMAQVDEDGTCILALGLASRKWTWDHLSLLNFCTRHKILQLFKLVFALQVFLLL